MPTEDSMFMIRSSRIFTKLCQSFQNDYLKGADICRKREIFFHGEKQIDRVLAGEESSGFFFHQSSSQRIQSSYFIEDYALAECCSFFLSILPQRLYITLCLRCSNSHNSPSIPKFQEGRYRICKVYFVWN